MAINGKTGTTHLCQVVRHQKPELHIVNGAQRYVIAVDARTVATARRRTVFVVAT